MAKKINVRLDDKQEKIMREIQKHYTDLTGIDITESGAIRIALMAEWETIQGIRGKNA